MAKSTNSGKEKQDRTIAQFSKDIRQMETRTWLTAVEQAIEDGKRAKEYRERQAVKEQVFISFHNPDSPLRGSSTWSKQQWEEYRQRQRDQKRAERLAAKNK